MKKKTKTKKKTVEPKPEEPKGIKLLSEDYDIAGNDRLDYEYRDRRGDYGYCESYKVLLPTPDNIGLMVRKINELIEEVNSLRKENDATAQTNVVGRVV